MKWVDDASLIVSRLISDAKNVKTQQQIKNELTCLLSSSMYPAILIAVLVYFHWDTLVVSWLLIIYLSRKINKEELLVFQRSNPVFKSRLIWLKIVGMLAGLLASRIGIEIIVYVSLTIFSRGSKENGETSKFEVGEEWTLFFEGIIKCLQFLQYFSFYRLYLYVFMAFGSFLVPKIKDRFPLPEDDSDKKTG